jgi:hypothetical protein
VALYAYPVFQFFSVSGPKKHARFSSHVVRQIWLALLEHGGLIWQEV